MASNTGSVGDDGRFTLKGVMEELMRLSERMDRREREEEERRIREEIERRDRRMEEKVEIPRFPKAPYWNLYVPWEKEVDNIYHSQGISDEKFLRLVILKFEGVVLTWWNKIVRLWRKERRPKIDTWQHMKLLLSTCCEPSNKVRQI